MCSVRESIFDIIAAIWLERLHFIKKKPNDVGFLGSSPSVMVPMLEELYPNRVSTLSDREKTAIRSEFLPSLDFLITDYYRLQKRQSLSEHLCHGSQLLKEQGLLFLVSLGAGTVGQLYDYLGINKKTSFLIHLEDLVESVEQAGFQELVCSVEKMDFQYGKLATLERDLQDLAIFSAIAEDAALSEDALRMVLEAKWPKEGLKVSYNFIFSHAIRKKSRHPDEEQVVKFYR